MLKVKQSYFQNLNFAIFLDFLRMKEKKIVPPGKIIINSVVMDKSRFMNQWPEEAII